VFNSKSSERGEEEEMVDIKTLNWVAQPYPEDLSGYVLTREGGLLYEVALVWQPIFTPDAYGVKELEYRLAELTTSIASYALEVASSCPGQDWAETQAAAARIILELGMERNRVRQS
jgi:hypothetical protein